MKDLGGVGVRKSLRKLSLRDKVCGEASEVCASAPPSPVPLPGSASFRELIQAFKTIVELMQALSKSITPLIRFAHPPFCPPLLPWFAHALSPWPECAVSKKRKTSFTSLWQPLFKNGFFAFAGRKRGRTKS